MKIAKIISILLLLNGCSSLGSSSAVTVQTEIITPEFYAPPSPRELQVEDIRWHVITEDNLEEKIIELTSLHGEMVIFGITPKGYENMSFNIQELIRYIKQQKEIILYYENSRSS